MNVDAETTYAWASWSTTCCLPRLLDRLGERGLAEQVCEVLPVPVVDRDSARVAFDVIRDISGVVVNRFGAGTDEAAAMIVAGLTLAELSDVSGDVGWLASRARYDAVRLAQHARAFGVRDEQVEQVVRDERPSPPSSSAAS